MQTLVKMARGSRRGFTLVEIIVVIAILGVLAAVVAPSVIGYINDAKNNTDEANRVALENLVKRLEAGGKIDRATMTEAQINTEIKKEMNIPAVKATGKSFWLAKGGTVTSVYLNATAITVGDFKLLQ